MLRQRSCGRRLSRAVNHFTPLDNTMDNTVVGLVPETSLGAIPNGTQLLQLDPAQLAGSLRFISVSAAQLREFCDRHGFRGDMIEDGKTYTVEVSPPPGLAEGSQIAFALEPALGIAAPDPEPDWLRGADAEERRELEDLG